MTDAQHIVNKRYLNHITFLPYTNIHVMKRKVKNTFFQLVVAVFAVREYSVETSTHLCPKHIKKSKNRFAATHPQVATGIK